jgi:hypothetical protein
MTEPVQSIEHMRPPAPWLPPAALLRHQRRPPAQSLHWSQTPARSRRR